MLAMSRILNHLLASRTRPILRNIVNLVAQLKGPRQWRILYYRKDVPATGVSAKFVIGTQPNPRTKQAKLPMTTRTLQFLHVCRYVRDTLMAKRTFLALRNKVLTHFSRHFDEFLRSEARNQSYFLHFNVFVTYSAIQIFIWTVNFVLL